LKRFLLFALVAVLVFFVARWWTSDERAIRTRLREIAAAASVPAHESELMRVTRAAQIRRSLTENVRIGAGNQALVSRDLVVAAAARWMPAAGGVTVDVVDVQVEVGPDHRSATAHLTAKITSVDPQTGGPAIDAREVVVVLEKVDREWLVSEARTEETLTR